MSESKGYTILAIPLEEKVSLNELEMSIIQKYVNEYEYASFKPSNINQLLENFKIPKLCSVLLHIFRKLVKLEHSLIINLIAEKLTEQIEIELKEMVENNPRLDNPGKIASIRKRLENQVLNSIEEYKLRLEHSKDSTPIGKKVENIKKCNIKSVNISILNELINELFARQDKHHLYYQEPRNILYSNDTALILLDPNDIYRGHIYVFQTLNPDYLQAIGIRTSLENLFCKHHSGIAIKLFYGVLLWAKKYNIKNIEVFPLEVMKPILKSLGFQQEYPTNKFYITTTLLDKNITAINPNGLEYVNFGCLSKY